MVKLRDEQKTELIKQEKKRRRIARLRQVRQQSAANAKITRDVVNQRKQEFIQEIREELHEQVDALMTEVTEKSLKLPVSAKRKTSTPRSLKKSSRCREMTESDLELAKKRNADAMKHLREAKKKKEKEQEEKLAKKKEAARKANAIMRGAQIL